MKLLYSVPVVAGLILIQPAFSQDPGQTSTKETVKVKTKHKKHKGETSTTTTVTTKEQPK